MLLKIGRHFIIDNTRIIIGRNNEENKKLRKLADKKDILMEVKDVPSPVTLIRGRIDEKILQRASELTVEYSDAAKMKKEKIEIVRLK